MTTNHSKAAVRGLVSQPIAACRPSLLAAVSGYHLRRLMVTRGMAAHTLCTAKTVIFTVQFDLQTDRHTCRVEQLHQCKTAASLLSGDETNFERYYAKKTTKNPTTRSLLRSGINSKADQLT